MIPEPEPLKINKVNLRSLIEFQSGQFSRLEAIEAFRMFTNSPKQIEGWIDDLLNAWLVEERKGKLFWVINAFCPN